MDIWLFLMDLVLLLGAAFIFGSLALKFKQSPILGYIFAGVAAGPFIGNTAMVGEMAELGVSLLLFSIGLEFSFGQVRRMGKTAFGGGAMQVGLTLILGAVVMSFFFNIQTALAMGAVLTLSSTTIVLRVLVARAQMESIQGRTSLGILLFQDMAIVPLVLMIGFLASPGTGDGMVIHMVTLLASVAGLALALYLVLYHLVPRLLSSAHLFADRELTVLLAVSTGLGATWAAHKVGISPALGAFVAGMLLGESPFAPQIRADIGSLRTMMVTLFFASVGMFIKPVWFMAHLHYILPLALVIFASKAGVIFGVTRLLGLNRRHALATGICLGQIGEFSFVLATAANQGGLMTVPAMDFIISVTIVLMMATPYMVDFALPLSDWLFSKSLGRSTLDSEVHESFGEPRVIVVGLGPAGRHVVKTLKSRGLMPVIIDVNPASQTFASRENAQIYLGDAANEEILSHAGLSRACMAVVTVPDSQIARKIIKTIRQLSPGISLVVRGRYNRHVKDLNAAGATLVVDEETLMGEELSRRIADYLTDEDCTLMACRLSGQQTPDPAGPES